MKDKIFVFRDGSKNIFKLQNGLRQELLIMWHEAISPLAVYFGKQGDCQLHSGNVSGNKFGLKMEFAHRWNRDIKKLIAQEQLEVGWEIARQRER